jgi:hypothetical protein
LSFFLLSFCCCVVVVVVVVVAAVLVVVVLVVVVVVVVAVAVGVVGVVAVVVVVVVVMVMVVVAVAAVVAVAICNQNYQRQRKRSWALGPSALLRHGRATICACSNIKPSGRGLQKSGSGTKSILLRRWCRRSEKAIQKRGKAVERIEQERTRNHTQGAASGVDEGDRKDRGQAQEDEGRARRAAGESISGMIEQTEAVAAGQGV